MKGRFFIQIKYNLTTKLSDYIEKVKEKKWIFPTFFECCPICHGQNCPVRIGYYYRLVLDSPSGLFITVPIARYKCRRKQRPINNDLTFSLLPDTLIPYYAPTIATLMEIVEYREVLKKSNMKILDYLYDRFQDELFNLSERSLIRYYRLFHQTVLKLKYFLRSKVVNAPPGFLNFNSSEFIEYIKAFSCSESSHTGAVKLSNYYDLKYGSYLENARYLFGTAYQFR